MSNSEFLKTLYFDGSSGVAGNMVVGALLEIVGDQEWFLGELQKLHLDGYEISITRQRAYGLTGTLVEVIVDGTDEMGHVHHLHHGQHHHEHRHLSDISDIIERSDLSVAAKKLARDIFKRVSRAEASVHGESLEEVHFHEVGAIDSIIDICGSAILLDKIAPEQIIVGNLCEGTGFIDCAHGRLSVPVPATSEILRAGGVPFQQIDVPTEMITPTGAAIIATIADKFSLQPNMRVDRVGYGAGTRDLGRANLLRVSLGEVVLTSSEATWVIDTNIDDATGEELGHCLEQLLAAGAWDAFYTPIMMKKNRPASKLEVICPADKRSELLEIIFRETTTIGVRFYPVERAVLRREMVTLDTPFGRVDAKKVTTPAGEVYIYPEYESMKALSAQAGVPIKVLRHIATGPEVAGV